MNWSTFYLTLFLVGFALTAVSLAAGFFHLPLAHGVHLPHPGAHPGAHPAGHAAGGTDTHHAGSSASPFNFATAMAFLAWFGGGGYLFSEHTALPSIAVLALALAAGLAGSFVVFAFLTRVLLKRESALDRADFDMVGVLGRVIVGIRPGGTGEITYSQAGTRRTAGARRDGEGSIGRGIEVVVTRYEKGIAYVRPWEEL